jgi:ABC-type branched-subunit amino acid transport system ATPase component
VRPLLATAGLQVFYGDFQALFGVDVEVGPGEVVAIVGANGAGKSTFLNAVCGVLRVPPRQVLLDGDPIGGLPAHRIAARGVAMVPEGRRLFGSLTVEDNRARISAARDPSGSTGSTSCSRPFASAGGRCRKSSRGDSSRWRRSAAR